MIDVGFMNTYVVSTPIFTLGNPVLNVKLLCLVFFVSLMVNH